MNRPSLLTGRRYSVLLLTLLVFFVATPFLVAGRSGGAAGGFLFVLVMLGVVIAVGRGRMQRYGVVLGAVVALLMLWNALAPRGGVSLAEVAARILFLAVASAVILVDVARSSRVTLDTVLGSGCVYLLLGILWSHLYFGMLLLDPGAFSPPVGSPGPGGLPGGLFYFSFVTLTTLGYGDVVPVSPGARVMTTLEAITGQLFLVILVARLVALEVAHRPRPDRPS